LGAFVPAYPPDFVALSKILNTDYSTGYKYVSVIRLTTLYNSSMHAESLVYDNRTSSRSRQLTILLRLSCTKTNKPREKV